MTGSTWSAIDTAFRDEGFTPIPEPEDADGSVRRTRTQEYLNSVDWTDAGEVSRAIRAFERLLVDVRPDGCTAPATPGTHSSGRWSVTLRGNGCRSHECHGRRPLVACR